MPKKKYLFSHLEFLAFRMSEVIPLPFTLFPRPGTPYEVFWNSEHVHLYEVHFSLPLKERNLHVQQRWALIRSVEKQLYDVEDDLICFVCLTGDVSEGNDIVICDGDHSEPRGCHQLCCQPPLSEIPDGPWLCPDCLQDHVSAPPSRGTDADYVPSVTCTDATSSSASSSNSSSSSDSSDGSSDSSDDSSSDSSNSSSSNFDDS